MSNKEIIRNIEQNAKRRGLKESTLCRLAVNDGKLYGRLKEGKSMTLATLDKLNSYFSATEPAE